jgi:uncharacterized protein YeaO (DUF488 family)
MSIRIVRLGSPRAPDEGTRIGTVRRPPRGVPKREFARQDWYDTWFPVLAPSVETMRLGQSAETPAQWSVFIKRYRKEMAASEAVQALALLAALSKEQLLRGLLLRERGALPSFGLARVAQGTGRSPALKSLRLWRLRFSAVPASR